MVRQSCGARIDGREQNFSARGKFCTALCERPLHAHSSTPRPDTKAARRGRSPAMRRMGSIGRPSPEPHSSVDADCGGAAGETAELTAFPARYDRDQACGS
jgi:hypothetical protein